LVLIVTLSPDFFSNAETMPAMAFFGTGSDALEPSVVDFELELPLPPDLLPPVQAARTGTAATPATPAAMPFSTVRRAKVVASVLVGSDPVMRASSRRRCDTGRFRTEVLTIQQNQTPESRPR
jgi:hypothetical protein